MNGLFHDLLVLIRRDGDVGKFPAYAGVVAGLPAYAGDGVRAGHDGRLAQSSLPLASLI